MLLHIKHNLTTKAKLEIDVQKVEKKRKANLSEELSPLVSSKVILHIRAARCPTISRVMSARVCVLLRLSPCARWVQRLQ